MSVGGLEKDAVLWMCRKEDLTPPAKYSYGSNNGSFSANLDFPYTGALWVSKRAGCSTWAHECTHCAIHTARTLGIDTSTGEEFVATYVGYLMRELQKVWAKK